ncbi:hypothetical protein PAMC26510_00040 [Caballeronia sordidicola]|uniref:Uncharacterized protein n=1 Tax=Caballeronia sordidicola TaxID=196367 RepID=A0A242NAE3_CABSO|nr:hypothetical protein PAMC26510_00040 [Caballeronia sordidicola]
MRVVALAARCAGVTERRARRAIACRAAGIFTGLERAAFAVTGRAIAARRGAVVERRAGRMIAACATGRVVTRAEGTAFTVPRRTVTARSAAIAK